MAWNDTFGEDTEWGMVAFVEMFWKAYYERRSVRNESLVTSPLPAEDATLQTATTSAPSGTTGTFSWTFLQQWIIDNCGSFSDPAKGSPPWAISSPPVAFTLATFYAAAGLNASGFTRKYERELSGTGEVQRVDLSGGDDPTGGTWTLTILGETITGIAWNVAAATLQTSIRALTFANAIETTVSKSGFQYNITFPKTLGDVATVTVDDSGLINGGTQTTTITTVTPVGTTYADGSSYADGHRARRQEDGKAYDRVSGVWVVVADNPLNTLPDLVTAYGVMQSNDVIGPWIFNEIRDCFNKLTRKLLTMSTLSTDANRGNGAFVTGFSAAMDNAEADWGNGLVAGNLVRSGSWCQLHPTTPNSFEGDVLSGEVTHQKTGVYNDFEASYAICFSADADFGIATDLLTFSAQGTSFVENTIIAVDTGTLDGSGGTTTITGPLLGDADRIPDRCDEPMVAGESTGKGFGASFVAIVVDYDFEFAP